MLHVIMYHYVRDLPRTPYPSIKGMLLDDFREQVRALAETFEMASLETCIAYLRAEYSPRRDLCLLTFDDGLKEHFTEVTPILQDSGIQGVFHLITSCTGEHQVAPVHMNHFLTARLGFEEYRRVFLAALASNGSGTPAATDRGREVAEFKYLFNFQLNPGTRDRAVRDLFEGFVGPVAEFSEELYVNWEEARQMQRAGMVIGGHTHEHRPLASLSPAELKDDLETCTRLLYENLQPQSCWPFCYPYGKSDSYQPAAVEMLMKLGFHCGFTTESGCAVPGDEAFHIRRLDCKKAPLKSNATVIGQGSAR